MMETLIQASNISEQILIKITKQIINKYEIQQIRNISQFGNDFNQVLHEMKLYSDTIHQLFNKENYSLTHLVHLLRVYHKQIYKIIDFLFRNIQKIHIKAHHQKDYRPQMAICSSCSHYIQEKNIKNLQREMFDQRYYVQMLDNQFRRQFQEEDRQQDLSEKNVLSEVYFRKKMQGIQMNIQERQNSLMECIDDFELLRTNMLVQIKRREQVGHPDSFNIRECVMGLSDHLSNIFQKIQTKISRFKKSNISYEDQGVQISQDQPESAVILAQKNDLQKQFNKLEVDYKRILISNSKFEESSKKYHSELKQSIAKAEALESIVKRLRDEVYSQKIKTSYKQKMIKTIQQKSRREQEENIKKQNAISIFKSIIKEQAGLASQFSQSLQQSLNEKNGFNKTEQPISMIKQAFKQALGRYLVQQTPVLLQKSKNVKNEPQMVTVHRKRSRRKSMRIQLEMQNGKQSSRFSKVVPKEEPTLQIHRVFDIKIVKGDKYKRSPSNLNLTSQIDSVKSSQKDMLQMRSQKRKRLTKLSIFSELNEQKIIKKRQSTQFFPQSQIDLLGYSTLNNNRKIMKKSNFQRNKSQESLKSNSQIQQSFKIIKVKQKQITGKAIKQFLFLADEQNRPRDSRMNLGQRSRHLIEQISSQSKIQKHRILTLQQLGYLTSLFSMLAKIHLVNLILYNKIKQWILSVNRQKKCEDSTNNLIIRKVVSQIIFKHRDCKYTTSLCSHLTQFLHSIQQFLLQAEVQSIEQARNSLVE